MSAVRFRLLLLALFSLVFVDRASPPVAVDASRAPPIASLATVKVPVRFEANAGQLDEHVRFIARKSGGALFLTNEGATLSVRTSKKQRKQAIGAVSAAAAHDGDATPTVTESTVIGFKVAGARAGVVPQAGEQLVTKTNYLIGNDPSKWHVNVPTFAKVTYASVLDGVDLVYHGDNGKLEYDFVVAPGTNVDTIAMNVEGAEGVSLTAKGDLAIHTAMGDLVQPRPLVYQRDASGTKEPIASSYRLVDKTKVGFEVASYDRSKPLVIDPVLAFSTYLGGSEEEEGYGVAADLAGNTYVTGSTLSSNFPTTVGPTFHVGGSCDGPCEDVFVAKLTPAGAVSFATYLGGAETDEGFGVAVHTDGSVFVAGTTRSSDFPVTGDPLAQPPAFGSVKNSPFFGTDAFIARLTGDGATRLYVDYIPFGQNVGNGAAYAVAVDASGRAYFTGETTPNLRKELGVSPAANTIGFNGQGAAYAARLLPNGTDFDGVPRFLDGFGNDSGFGIGIDGNGNAYITGSTSSSNFPWIAVAGLTCHAGETSDAFVARLETTWPLAFTYVTCLGGGGTDSGNAIAVDTAGNAYVAGSTGPDVGIPFPTLGPAQATNAGGSDGFVTKLGPTGAPIYSTFIGGGAFDDANGIGVDPSGAAWVTGLAGDGTFPETANNPPIAGGGEDAFVARLNPAGNMVQFSLLFGGSASDHGQALAVSSGTSIHVVGSTSPSQVGADFPVFNAAQPTAGGNDDSFVAKISVPQLIISPPSVVLSTGGAQTFVAAGGAGYGFVYSILTNGSGGTIDPTTGAYTAGGAGGTTDIIEVKDAFDLTATASVQVGAPTTQLVISPATATVPPKGSRNFTASGGTPPYQFFFASNASGASISQTGAYTAGTKGNVVDIVRVRDAANNFATATITVTAALAITPAKPATPPLGKLNFFATGGSGGGYSWALQKNGSGGNINTGTGHYTAGSAASSVDTVKVTDSLGNTATVNVSVGGGLAITPSEPTTTTRGTIPFEAVGGSGAYTWSLKTNLSGGTIDPLLGIYVAGANGNVQDVVNCADNLGANASVNVAVGPSLTLTPSVASVATTGKVAFSAAGGSGTGYTFSIPTNQSGGNIGADGVYTAGNAGGVDTIRLVDSLGSQATATVTVVAPPPVPSNPANPPVGFDGGTIPGINLGGGGADDCSCRAVGSSSGSSGLPNSTRAIAALALVLGLVWRRRQRR